MCAACDARRDRALAGGSERARSAARAPIADAPDLGIGDRAARDVLAVVTSSYEHHGGFRLRTLSAEAEEASHSGSQRHCAAVAPATADAFRVSARQGGITRGWNPLGGFRASGKIRTARARTPGRPRR